MNTIKMKKLIIEIIATLLALALFGVPFYFVVVNSGKDAAAAARMTLSFPETTQYLDNFRQVITASNSMLIRAFFNSFIISAATIIVLIVIASSAGFVLGRRKGKAVNIISFLVLAGLMVPPAIVPTIWLLRTLGLYKSLTGLILVEAAIMFPFTLLLYRGYVTTIPRELDEASLIDGTGPVKMFSLVIFPLLKPVSVTVTIINAITIFNDFVHPLYFLPGAKNATVQLTLYNFMSTFSTKWNLLYADVLIISIPPLIFFILFNSKIVSGMVAGAVKG